MTRKKRKKMKKKKMMMAMEMMGKRLGKEQKLRERKRKN